MVTYDKICDKLGFEPKDAGKHRKPIVPGVIDDSPSIWSVLSLEESDMIWRNDWLHHSPYDAGKTDSGVADEIRNAFGKNA